MTSQTVLHGQKITLLLLQELRDVLYAILFGFTGTGDEILL